MSLSPALNEVEKKKKNKIEPLDDHRSSYADLLAEGLREKIPCLFWAGQCLLQKIKLFFLFSTFINIREKKVFSQ